MHRKLVNLLVRSLLVTLFLLGVSAASFAQVSIGISVGFAPPPLPVYEQPICPAEGTIWVPGYWAWDGDDYYWVPGTWVRAPEIGFLWTPGWWGWGGTAFIFHEGYWGPHVGWYGGISYGFGYFGRGYEGGRWDGDHFYYNREVNNVNVNIVHNVYNTHIENTTINRVSYNGGNGGVTERPTPQEEQYMHERHVAPVTAQTQHMNEARSNRELRASVNQGKPPIAATARPAEFNNHTAIVPAKTAGGNYQPPPNRGNASYNGNTANRPPANAGSMSSNSNTASRPPVHPNDLPAYERPAPPNTGNPKQDQKYQQQQQKMYAKQGQERQKLQQQQDQEHQKMMKQNADQARQQQVEQKHQQQTQQMQQRHVQQQQQLQQRQAPPPQQHPSQPPHH